MAAYVRSPSSVRSKGAYPLHSEVRQCCAVSAVLPKFITGSLICDYSGVLIRTPRHLFQSLFFGTGAQQLTEPNLVSAIADAR
jgi:hypothetical protein